MSDTTVLERKEIEEPNTSPSSTLELLPGSDVMGKGYDVTDEYGRNDSVLDQNLFDFPRDMETLRIKDHTYNYNELFGTQTLFSSEIKTINGESIEEYHRAFSQQIGVDASYGLFSGSVNTAFGREAAGLTHTSYTTVTEVHRLWRVSLPSSNQLKEFLKPKIQQDLDDITLEADVLFDRYGSQYIGEAIIGGRIDYHSSTKRLRTSRIDDFSLTATASYHGLTGSGSVSSSTERNSAVSAFNRISNRRLEAVGGEPGLDDMIFEGDHGAYSRWAKSLQDYAVLVDFTERSLRPIWELASDPERQQQLESSFQKWLDSKRTMPTSNRKVLDVNFRPSMKLDGTDSGSGAHQDLSVFYPSSSRSVYWGGQQGQANHHSTRDNASPRFRDHNDLGLLKKPVSFELIWSDAGAGNSRDYSCWRPLPPEGYRTLGDIMILGRKTEMPDLDDPRYSRLRCVHESLCRNVRRSDLNPLWTDSGSGANDNLKLYRINHGHRSFTFFGREVEDYDQSVSDGWIRRNLNNMGIIKSSVVR